jgi:hypothetical protein
VIQGHLTTEEASVHLLDKFCLGNGSSAFLDHLAHVGTGPAYRRLRRRRLYAPEKLDAWGTAQLGPEQVSTAENVSPHGGGRPRKARADYKSGASRKTARWAAN